MKAAKDRNAELQATVARYQESEAIYNRYVAVLEFYKQVRIGEANTQRSSDNIADFLEELEAKLPTNMTISKFTTDDEVFSMDVEVLDRNTAIGCIEIIRTLDSVSGVSIEMIEEKESRVSEEELADLKEMGFTAIDETEKDAKPKDNKDEDEDGEEEEEEAVLVIEGNENADDTALSVKHIGTYFLRIDPETHEKYYVRKYVSFSISCVYTPAEQVEITNNIDNVGEVAE